MIFRIYYSNSYTAADKDSPKTGTQVEINTPEDIEQLQKQLGEKFIFHFDNLPWFLANWEQCGTTEDHFDDDDLEWCHLLEKPNKSWLESNWLEVYNGYRE